MTPSEKKKIVLYWEEQRQNAYRIKDEYDKVQEDKYHSNFYNNFLYKSDKSDKSNKINKINTRPEFFSPLPKYRKITK